MVVFQKALLSGSQRGQVARDPDSRSQMIDFFEKGASHENIQTRRHFLAAFRAFLTNLQRTILKQSRVRFCFYMIHPLLF